MWGTREARKELGEREELVGKELEAQWKGGREFGDGGGSLEKALEQWFSKCAPRTISASGPERSSRWSAEVKFLTLIHNIKLLNDTR